MDGKSMFGDIKSKLVSGRTTITRSSYEDYEESFEEGATTASTSYGVRRVPTSASGPGSAYDPYASRLEVTTREPGERLAAVPPCRARPADDARVRTGEDQRCPTMTRPATPGVAPPARLLQRWSTPRCRRR
ncbi:MAG: hypothetical protein ACLTDR_08475 [Adlercreutzia equolifaciens]